MSDFLHVFRTGWRALGVGAIALAGAGCDDTQASTTQPPDRPLSSALPDNMADCDALRETGYFADFFDEGNTLAIRCFLAIRDVEPDSFELRYLLYRLEGVEPEGLDQIVRSSDRLELASRLGYIHDIYPFLEPFGWDGGCPTFDARARELLSRTPPQREVRGCRRWGL